MIDAIGSAGVYVAKDVFYFLKLQWERRPRAWSELSCWVTGHRHVHVVDDDMERCFACGKEWPRLPAILRNAISEWQRRGMLLDSIEKNNALFRRLDSRVA